MNKLYIITLLIFVAFSSYAQKLSCFVFIPEVNKDKLLVDTIFKSGQKYFIHTKKGDVQPATIKKKVYCDTTFFIVKNFPYMVNLKYYSLDVTKVEALIFYNKGTNSIILKQIFSKESSNYRFKFLKKIDDFVIQ